MADGRLSGVREAGKLDEHAVSLQQFDGCRRLDAVILALRASGMSLQPQSPASITSMASVSASTPAAGPLSPTASKSRTTPGYLVPRALAKRWSVCVDKVLGFIKTGELRAFNVASAKSRRPRYRISIEEVRRFEEQTRSAASPRSAESKTARRRKPSATTPPARAYF